MFLSPSQRSPEDIEVIYEELLHVKAVAHLSTSVSQMNTSVRFRHKQITRPSFPQTFCLSRRYGRSWQQCWFLKATPRREQSVSVKAMMTSGGRNEKTAAILN